MSDKKNTEIAIVIPAYNEEGNVRKTADLVTKVLSGCKKTYEIIFVDDGSTDSTLEKLIQLNKEDAHIKFLSLSRNFGHQSALIAGLNFASGEAVISMDADLQHPPELLPQLISKWEEGYDVVYTKRKADPNLPFLKRKTSKIFYKLINTFSDIKLEEGTSDFRLMDKKVVSVIKELPENNLFLRGLIKWVGFKQYCVEYMPQERNNGKSKYSYRKMISLAISGVTSTSIFPLRIASMMGFTLSIAALGYSLVVIYDYFFTDKNLTGWTTLIIAILFLGGAQLITLGIIGEYLGKLLLQAKGRPKYIVKRTPQNEKK
jgi:glycosyltransferase involved in cell wall biosynthesis